MAFVAIPGGMWFGGYLAQGAGSPAFAVELINADGEKVAYVFRAPKAGTLESVGLRFGTSSAANGLTVSWQDINLSTGFPDGTADEFRAGVAPVSNGWANSGIISSDGSDTGTKRTVTRGQLLALVIEFTSFQAGDSVNIAVYNEGSSQHPHVLHDAGSGYVPQSTAPIVAIKYDDGTYAFLMARAWPVSDFNTTTFNSGSTPDERALRFTVPAPMKVGAVWVRIDLDNDADIVLYDDEDNALETISLDSDVRGSTSGHDYFIHLTQEIELEANTVYRLAVKPGASSVTVYSIGIDDAAMLGAFEGGTSWHLSTRTDAGSWTDDNTERPLMGLLITAVDDGAGEGGSGGGLRLVGHGGLVA